MSWWNLRRKLSGNWMERIANWVLRSKGLEVLGIEAGSSGYEAKPKSFAYLALLQPPSTCSILNIFIALFFIFLNSTFASYLCASVLRTSWCNEFQNLSWDSQSFSMLVLQFTWSLLDENSTCIWAVSGYCGQGRSRDAQTPIVEAAVPSVFCA